MSNFKDLLDQPLPSKRDIFSESSEDDDIFNSFFESDEDEPSSDEEYESGEDEDDSSEDTSDDVEEGADCSYYEDDDYDDLDDMDDDEIADSINDLDDDLGDDDDDYDDLDDELGDEDDADDDGIPDDMEDEEVPQPLEGEDDVKADEMMAIATTPVLIRDELTAEEAVNFYESSDYDIAVNEGLVLESDVEDLYQEGVFASPNKPFKMTKKARFRQLYEMSVLIEARMHNDPIYTKLEKAYRIERINKKKLRKKYHGLAIRRAKIYLKRLTNSKSGVLKNIGKKLGIKK